MNGHLRNTWGEGAAYGKEEGLTVEMVSKITGLSVKFLQELKQV